MQIKTFKLEKIKLTKPLKQKVKNAISQNRGATLQKLTQLFDESENRELISDKSVTEDVIAFISKSCPSLSTDLESISENFYQGSIGNIHCGLLKSGEKVAIKTLRKGVKEKILDDYKNSEGIINIASNFVNTKKFNSLDGFSKNFIRSLQAECDFTNEINNYKKVASYLDNFQYLKIPKVFKEYSQNDILVIDWIESTHNLDDLSDFPIEDREEMQKELSEFFYYFPLKYGITQEDSNLSNFIVNNKNIYLIDFGKIEFIPLNFRIAFVKLLEVLDQDRDISIIDLYKKMGFNKTMLLPLENLLYDISKILLQPLLCNIKLNFHEWEPTKKIDTIAHNLKWNLRSSAPMHYFSLTRSFFGYVKLSKLINCPINQSHIREELLRYFHNDLKQYDVKASTHQHYNFVNIRVVRNSEEKVNLHLPYTSLFELEELINDEIKEKLKKRNLDIKDLVEKAIKEKRSDIFKLEEGDSYFEVCLAKT